MKAIFEQITQPADKVKDVDAGVVVLDSAEVGNSSG